MMIRLEPQMIKRHDIIVVDSKNKPISDRRLIKLLDALYDSRALTLHDDQKFVFDEVTVFLKSGNRAKAFVKLERSSIPELLFEQFSVVIRF